MGARELGLEDEEGPAGLEARRAAAEPEEEEEELLLAEPNIDEMAFEKLTRVERASWPEIKDKMLLDSIQILNGYTLCEIVNHVLTELT